MLNIYWVFWKVEIKKMFIKYRNCASSAEIIKIFLFASCSSDNACLTLSNALIIRMSQNNRIQLAEAQAEIAQRRHQQQWQYAQNCASYRIVQQLEFEFDLPAPEERQAKVFYYTDLH
jgi:hypothetical protein